MRPVRRFVVRACRAHIEAAPQPAPRRLNLCRFLVARLRFDRLAFRDPWPGAGADAAQICKIVAKNGPTIAPLGPEFGNHAPDQSATGCF